MCYRTSKCLNNKVTLSEETERIKSIIKNNNYKPQTIDKIVRRTSKPRKREIQNQREKGRKISLRNTQLLQTVRS